MALELKVEIFGMVQGLLFRKRVTSMAEILNLKGFVKNQEDGSVLIVAQGRESALTELLSWAQKAPFPLKITGMSYAWRETKNDYKDFKVLKDKPFLQDHAQGFMNLGKEMLHLNKNQLNVPNHVVIIPDGNRRWAQSRGWKAWIGHRRATNMDRLTKLFMEAKDIGVKYLTFWAFSTENWKRDKREVDEIFGIVIKLHGQMGDLLDKEQIRFRHMGRRDRLPKKVLDIILDLEAKTAKYERLNFQLCLDYNGRDDLVRAFQKMSAANIKNIDEEIVSNYLDSKGIPDPDLIIRTSGEQRTSGIMAYQAAYAELYFTNVYFPDFDSEQFRLAIWDYSARTRRFGGTANISADVHVDQVDSEELPLGKEHLAY